jgi:hypothetical protein
LKQVRVEKIKVVAAKRLEKLRSSPLKMNNEVDWINVASRSTARKGNTPASTGLVHRQAVISNAAGRENQGITSR